MKQDANKVAIEALKNMIKTDENTGKYTNASKVGRNVSIGLLVILIGILYSIGGISVVVTGLAVIVALLIVSSVIIYILVKTKVV